MTDIPIPTPAEIDALRTKADSKFVEARTHDLEAQIASYLQEDFYPIEIDLGRVSSSSTTYPIYAGIVKARLELAGWKVSEKRTGNWRTVDGSTWCSISWVIDKRK